MSRLLQVSISLLLLALAWKPLPSWSQQAAGDQTLVLKGATLIDGTGKAPIPESVIVIERDRIKTVGGKGTQYPSDAKILDLSGKFVIPGLVDSHVHYEKWMGEMLLNYGVTTVIAHTGGDAFGRDYLPTQQPDFRSPRFFDPGTPLHLAPSMTREQVHTVVQEWMKSKPEFARLPDYNEEIKQVYQWANEEFLQAGLASISHTEDCLGAIRAGLTVIEHGWGCAKDLMSPTELENFREGKYLHWALFFKDEGHVDQLIREVVKAGGIEGVYFNPTLLYLFSSQTSLAHKFELQSYEAFRDPALMTYFPKDLAEGLPTRFRTIEPSSAKYGNMVPVALLSDDELRQFKEAYRLMGHFVKRWVDLGGKILGGTDVPQVGTPGLSPHMEMAMLVECGLTPMQALQAETMWGAEIMTVRRRTPTKPTVGWIGAGNYADLLILAADPLENIENTEKIDRVMKGGKFIKPGYTPYYAVQLPQIGVSPAIPVPEISAIVPNRVVEGGPDLEMVVDGEGFMPNSAVRIDDVAVPTTFVDIRTLKVKIPAAIVASATPNPYNLSFAPQQRVGVFGDRTVKVTVFNAPPDGGTSNSISLKVIAKWLADERQSAKKGKP